LSELQSSRPYPLTRAFVVKLHAEAEPRHGGLCGRVEHVASGRRGEFRSADQLLAWLAGALEQQAREECPTGDAAAGADCASAGDPLLP